MSKPTLVPRKLFTALPYAPDEDEFFRDFRSLLSSQNYTNRGPWVQKFESALLEHLGKPQLEITSCANATLGLELAIKALKLRKKVIVTPFTFVASVSSLINCGIEPVFADIDPETFCLSPDSVRENLDRNVTGVLAVHAYGNVCDTDEFDWIRKRGVKVLYDSAHAFGVRKSGTAVGSFGDAEVFSFHATKILHSFEGGAVVSRDPELIRKIRMMSNFGIVSETEVEAIGTNAKMSEVHALMGMYSLKHLKALIGKRAESATAYRKRLEKHSSVRLPKIQQDVERNFQYFPILLENQKTRDALYDDLKAKEIISRKYFYPPIHQLGPYRNFAKAPLPVTESISQRILCLPMHSYLGAKDVEYVCESIERHFGKGAKRKAA